MFEFITLAAKDYGIVENLKSHGITVTASGFGIVFLMLIFLILVMSAFGAVMSRAGKSKKEKQPKANKNIKSDNTDTSDDSDEVLAVISAAVMMMDEEIVAAISAAVNMMYEGSGKRPIIRSIKPAGAEKRSAWATAGVINATRPF